MTRRRTPVPPPRSLRHIGAPHRLRALVFAFHLLALGLPSVGYAHGQPATLNDWGNFNRSRARCQRMIGFAAGQCGLAAWDVRRACREAELAGETCDTEAASNTIEGLRRNAIDIVAASCPPLDVQNLRFTDLFEAQTDVIRFCREVTTAVESAVFGPAGSDTSDPEVNACRLITARTTSNLLALAFDSRTGAMNRIAASAMPAMRLSRKTILLQRSADYLTWAREPSATRIATVCPEAMFESIYGRSTAAFLIGITSRADCLVGATYAQAAVTCIPPICGNGMQEPGEQCDDGNSDEGDLCKSNCSKTAPTAADRQVR